MTLSHLNNLEYFALIFYSWSRIITKFGVFVTSDTNWFSTTQSIIFCIYKLKN